MFPLGDLFPPTDPTSNLEESIDQFPGKVHHHSTEEGLYVGVDRCSGRARHYYYCNGEIGRRSVSPHKSHSKSRRKLGQFPGKVHHHSTEKGYCCIVDNVSHGSADSMVDMSILSCQAGTRAEMGNIHCSTNYKWSTVVQGIAGQQNAHVP